MNLSEANECVSKLTRLYPAMNSEQGATLSLIFERFAPDVAASAIEAHYQRFQYVTANELVAEMERLSRKHSSTALARHAAECEAYAARVQAREQEAADIAETNAKAARIVAALPQDRRDKFKAEILAASPFLTARLADKPVMESPTLIGMIALKLGRGAT